MHRHARTFFLLGIALGAAAPLPAPAAALGAGAALPDAWTGDDPPSPIVVPVPAAGYPPGCDIAPTLPRFSKLRGVDSPGSCPIAPDHWLKLPADGGTLTVPVEACKTNAFALKVVGDLTDGNGRPIGNIGRTAGFHAFATATPSQEEQYNSSQCGDIGHNLIVKNILQGLNYRLGQDASWAGNPARPCDAGVYTIEYRPPASDIGKTTQTTVQAQILVTPTEYHGGWRESALTQWTLKFDVKPSAACPVAVTIAPKSTTAGYGEVKAFTATVANAANTAVSWSASAGSVAATGPNSASYTAPGMSGTFQVFATSVADPTRRDAATVTVSGLNRAPLFAPDTPTAFDSAYGQGTACSAPVAPTPVAYTFAATDADGDAVRFSLRSNDGQPVPANLSLTASGAFYWDGYAPHHGDYTVHADDGRGAGADSPLMLDVHLLASAPCGGGE